MSREKNATLFLMVAAILLMIAAGVFATQRLLRSKQQIPQPDYTQLYLNHIANLEATIEGQLLNNQWAFWGNDSLNGFPLEQLATEERLYFYFSQNVCPPCIMQTVDLLKRYFPHYETDDRIIFISPDWPFRLRSDCYGKKLLTLQRGRLEITLEVEDVPFFFKLTPKLELTSLHIVTKEDFVRTEAFLKELADLFER